MTRTLAALVSAAVAVSLLGCGNSVTNPSLPKLEGAPLRVEIGGSELKLETYIWRDFQPIAPPDGRPMIAVLRVSTTDGTSLPPGVTADQVSIIFAGDIWTSSVQEHRSENLTVLEVVAREGPKWGPDVMVDVVVRLRDARGSHYWLRAEDQPIHSTW